MEEKILVLDFGGQYNQLIARRVREQQVYAEIKPYNQISVSEIKEAGYKGCEEYLYTDLLCVEVTDIENHLCIVCSTERDAVAVAVWCNR